MYNLQSVPEKYCIYCFQTSRLCWFTIDLWSMVSDGFQYFFWCAVCFLATSSLRLCSWNNLHRVYQVSISSSDLWYYILCFKFLCFFKWLNVSPKALALCSPSSEVIWYRGTHSEMCKFSLQLEVRRQRILIPHWSYDLLGLKTLFKKKFYTPSIYLCNFRHWISLSTVHFPYLLLPP